MTFNPLRLTEAALIRVIQNMWASSTWHGRQHILDRFLAFTKQNNLDWNADCDHAIAMFVESTRRTTVPAARLKYSMDLTSIFTRLGFSELPLTRMYQAGLRGASGALIPTEQATLPCCTVGARGVSPSCRKR